MKYLQKKVFKKKKQPHVVHDHTPLLFGVHARHFKVPLIALCAISVAALLSIMVASVEDFSRVSSFFKQQEPSPLELEIREMVKGYPIENMAPYIAEQDPKTAAFLVSIAKKESNWGKRVPVLDGKDCYNYWGYRGKSDRMGTGGHTCFKSPRSAVSTVAKRIDTLVEQNIDTPAEMIVWKCGYNCSGHSKSSVQKWISDVALYFKKFKQDK